MGAVLVIDLASIVNHAVCAYCGSATDGNYSIHRDGMGEGPGGRSLRRVWWR